MVSAGLSYYSAARERRMWAAQRKSDRRARRRSLCRLIQVSLVPVPLRLERPFHLDTDVIGLLLIQLRELGAELVEVQTGHFLVQLLGLEVDLLLHGLAFFPQPHLSQR